ncbi:DNA topoisomerase 2-binding protein 1-like [Pyrus ussuriensis x Pyrus communis]|uniref:DNA topoisomerase 2-binding protein 1-like n=1 Tax=Pyrus ussuriensis x Pyrus communis TaxID=2448454 RepID=A0A5N5HMX2_9ROSA|nr:DNA topoisomerase 2-binding protein 1-like [Pyrus ussuriensis x Pyrus communis]
MYDVNELKMQIEELKEEEEVVHENEDVEEDGEKDGDRECDVEEGEEQAEGEDENEEDQEMKEKGGTQGVVREEIMKVVGAEALKYRTAKEDVNGSNTDDEVVIFTLEGEHLGTKISEPLEDVVQRIALLKVVDKKCLLDAMEHFYHFKMVKENEKE